MTTNTSIRATLLLAAWSFIPALPPAIASADDSAESTITVAWARPDRDGFKVLDKVNAADVARIGAETRDEAPADPDSALGLGLAGLLAASEPAAGNED